MAGRGLAVAGSGLLILAAGAAFGQTDTSPSFDAASVKVPLPAGMMAMNMGGGPGSTDPGRIDRAWKVPTEN